MSYGVHSQTSKFEWPLLSLGYTMHLNKKFTLDLKNSNGWNITLLTKVILGFITDAIENCLLNFMSLVHVSTLLSSKLKSSQISRCLLDEYAFKNNRATLLFKKKKKEKKISKMEMMVVFHSASGIHLYNPHLTRLTQNVSAFWRTTKQVIWNTIGPGNQNL